MDGQQLLACFNGSGCSLDLLTRDREVAPFTIHLNGRLRVRCIRHRPTGSTGNGAAYQDVDARLARRVFGITWEPIEIGLRPALYTAVFTHTMIQVDPSVVPLEHIPDAVVGARVECLNRLSIAGPGLRS